MDIFSTEVAKVVDGLRVERNLGVSTLSKAARVPRTTLIRRLDGEPFALDEIARVADVLGTKVSEITRQAEGAA
jgi:predicted transcriptional regulator